MGETAGHILHILCVQVGGYSHGIFCMAESSEEQNDTCIGNEITVGAHGEK